LSLLKLLAIGETPHYAPRGAAPVDRRESTPSPCAVVHNRRRAAQTQIRSFLNRRNNQ
jgi:hypothetical protein